MAKSLSKSSASRCSDNGAGKVPSGGVCDARYAMRFVSLRVRPGLQASFSIAQTRVGRLRAAFLEIH
jgi:hypothetical protein